ncbi:lantibiotic dehydratase family protein [Streptosporangium sp. NBC_01639]|uniref:lantibiotic dehydratase n=1 Tax=Streptosporangium sp. NBC_01639 TaxID=2975948 RepID=UPI00386D316C|nr:lantibiotic dehydratase family protein [Streptosporangium sp. NBC_01639]
MPASDEVSDVFGVRVAGLPVDRLRALRFERTWTLVRRLAGMDRWLATEGEAICAALYQIIGDDRRAQVKPLLVGARRAVFAGRRPDRLEAVLVAVPEALAGRLRSWLACSARRAGAAAELPGTLAAEQAEKAAVLRELVADEAFQRGLSLSSPTLSAELSKWLASPEATPGRAVLLRLARYAARAAAKTSPYATFVISGLGRWAAAGPAVTGDPGLTWRPVAEFDAGSARRIWEAFCRDPGLAETVELRVNASLLDHDGRLWFLGAGRAEPIMSVPAGPELTEVVDLVRAADRPTLGSMRDRIGSGLLDRLLEIGLLERRPPFADQSADPLGELARQLDPALLAPAGSAPASSTGFGAVRDLRQAVLALPGMAEAGARRRTLACLREMTGDVLARHDKDPRPVAKDLCLDTAVSPRTMAWCGRAAWQPVLDDLNVVRRLLGLLDPALPAKLSAGEFFLRRYGPGRSVPFLVFYRDLHTVRRRPPAPAADLRALRRELWQSLYGTPQDAHGVITVNPALVAGLAAAWPAYLRPPASVACFVQAIDGPDGLRVAVNAIYSGYGRATARIRHLLGESERAVLAGGDVAECLASFGNTLNLRPAGATGIDYPFTDTGRAALSLPDLHVGYDPATRRPTLCDGDGRPVRPMHLGMSSELVLPPAWAFLIRTFGEPPVALRPAWQWTAGWQAERRETGRWPTAEHRAGAAGPVRHRPRLQLGHVVLARAGWRMPAAELPVAAKGEPEAAYLLRMASWLETHAIPERFFARLTSAERPWLGKGRKPLYLDVTDHFQLMSLTRSARDPAALLVLEEALPDPADAPSYGRHGSRVTEFVLEISAKDGR